MNWISSYSVHIIEKHHNVYFEIPLHPIDKGKLRLYHWVLIFGVRWVVTGAFRRLDGPIPPRGNWTVIIPLSSFYWPVSFQWWVFPSSIWDEIFDSMMMLWCSGLNIPTYKIVKLLWECLYQSQFKWLLNDGGDFLYIFWIFYLCF